MTSPWSCPAVMEALAAVTPCQRGEVICARGDPAEHWFRMVSGVARKCVVMGEGRRQIVEFLLPGDFFGFTAKEQYAVTVEAMVEGTVVARYPRARLETVANSDPRVGRYIRQMALQALSRTHARTLILARRSAVDKVRSFLAEMAERSSSGSPDFFILPTSRQDVADYLGLSAVTVSRALNDLRRSGAISPRFPAPGGARARQRPENAASD